MSPSAGPMSPVYASRNEMFNAIGALQGGSLSGLNANQAAQIAKSAQSAEQFRTMGQRRAAGLSGMPGAAFGAMPSNVSAASPLSSGTRPVTPGSVTLGSPDMTGRSGMQQQQMPGATVQAQLRQQQLIMIQQQQAGGVVPGSGALSGRSGPTESPASASPAESYKPRRGKNNADESPAAPTSPGATKPARRRRAPKAAEPEEPKPVKKPRPPPRNRNVSLFCVLGEQLHFQ